MGYKGQAPSQLGFVESPGSVLGRVHAEYRSLGENEDPREAGTQGWFSVSPMVRTLAMSALITAPMLVFLGALTELALV